MDSRAAIKTAIDMANLICESYLADLTDDEMMHRPHEKCNHIKWQLGHLILSEHQMINGCCPDVMPALPAGFEERYTRETADNNDVSAFDTKEELMKLYAEQRAGTLAALEKLSDADLDAATPEAMQGYAPNVGSAFSMQSSHWIMHAGQWAVVRRQLGRAPLF